MRSWRPSEVVSEKGPRCFGAQRWGGAAGGRELRLNVAREEQGGHGTNRVATRRAGWPQEERGGPGRSGVATRRAVSLFSLLERAPAPGSRFPARTRRGSHHLPFKAPWDPSSGATILTQPLSSLPRGHPAPCPRCSWSPGRWVSRRRFRSRSRSTARGAGTAGPWKPNFSRVVKHLPGSTLGWLGVHRLFPAAPDHNQKRAGVHKRAGGDNQTRAGGDNWTRIFWAAALSPVPVFWHRRDEPGAGGWEAVGAHRRFARGGETEAASRATS